MSDMLYNFLRGCLVFSGIRVLITGICTTVHAGNEACTDAINGLLRQSDFRDSEHLFRGQRGPIRPETVHALVKFWI